MYSHPALTQLTSICTAYAQPLDSVRAASVSHSVIQSMLGMVHSGKAFAAALHPAQTCNLRQVCACRYVFVEYGPMELDINLRVRVHELETALKKKVSHVTILPKCTTMLSVHVMIQKHGAGITCSVDCSIPGHTQGCPQHRRPAGLFVRAEASSCVRTIA